MIRRSFLAFSLALLAACGGTPDPLPPTPEPIGDFRMGFNIVVANDITKGPASRDATEEELTTALRAAMEERLGRYDGDGLYHIGLRIEAYSLGRAGVPLLFSPKSVFLVAFNIWDDATQEKLNEDPIRINAFDTPGGPFVGSGLVKTREEQIAALAYDAARGVEELLAENSDLWFGPKDGRERIEFTRDPLTGRQLIQPGEDGAEDSATAPDPTAN